MCGASRLAEIRWNYSGKRENSTGQARGIFVAFCWFEFSDEPENSTGQARGIFVAFCWSNLAACVRLHGASPWHLWQPLLCLV